MILSGFNLCLLFKYRATVHRSTWGRFRCAAQGSRPRKIRCYRFAINKVKAWAVNGGRGIQGRHMGTVSSCGTWEPSPRAVQVLILCDYLPLSNWGKYLSIRLLASLSHFSRSDRVLSAITRNIILSNVFMPQKSNMQSLHRRCKGSPKTRSSRSFGVLEVLNTKATFAFSSPIGNPPTATAFRKGISNIFL